MDGRKEGEEVWGGRKEGRARVTQYLIAAAAARSLRWYVAGLHKTLLGEFL